MIKLFISLGFLSSVTWAADADRHDDLTGTPVHGHLQPIQDLYDIKEEKQSTTEALGTLIGEGAHIVKDKTRAEWQRFDNRLQAQAARTEIQADKLREETNKKLKKLEKKGKKKTEKLKKKAKKLI
jgi:hypothetical protein